MDLGDSCPGPAGLGQLRGCPATVSKAAQLGPTRFLPKQDQEQNQNKDARLQQWAAFWSSWKRAVGVPGTPPPFPASLHLTFLSLSTAPPPAPPQLPPLLATRCANEEPSALVVHCCTLGRGLIPGPCPEYPVPPSSQVTVEFRSHCSWGQEPPTPGPSPVPDRQSLSADWAVPSTCSSCSVHLPSLSPRSGTVMTGA